MSNNTLLPWPKKLDEIADEMDKDESVHMTASGLRSVAMSFREQETEKRKAIKACHQVLFACKMALANEYGETIPDGWDVVQGLMDAIEAATTIVEAKP